MMSRSIGDRLHSEWLQRNRGGLLNLGMSPGQFQIVRRFSVENSELGVIRRWPQPCLLWPLRDSGSSAVAAKCALCVSVHCYRLVGLLFKRAQLLADCQ
jgi:hypothetical protein